MPADTWKSYIYLFFAITLAVVITVYASPAIAQTCSEPAFTQPPIYPVGRDVRSLAAADFDSDGHPDLAVANADANNVSVWIKAGLGVPAVNTTYNVGDFPLDVDTGDFNGDGKPDIVTVNNSSGNISLLLNNGAGGFVSASHFFTGVGGRAVAIGDFNGNNRPDVAVALGNVVVVLLGNGQGGFGAPISVPTQATELIAADFNGDGKLDLAVTFGPMRIMIGDGTGHFTENSCMPGSAINGLAAADLNGDGKLDLVSANVLAAQIHVMLGDGAGCFAPRLEIDVFNAGRPRYVSIGDLNNDGKPDIIGGTAVMLGTGTGTFSAAIAYGTGSFGPEPGANTVVIDFDGDGNLDIATAGFGSAGILFGDGAGGFKFAVGPSGRGASGIGRADFNADGKLDLVSTSSGNVILMLGDGIGGFGPPRSFLVPSSSSGLPVVADYNRDAKLDVAVLDATANGPGGRPRFHVLLGDGIGGFGSAISTSFDANQPADLAGGDFNGDGKPDLLTSNRAGGNNNEGSISVALGDGTGQFAPPMSFSARAASNPRSIGIADLNGDGKTDLAVPGGFGFSILLGDGSGGFGSRSHITTANSSSIAVADFNADGKPDLAMVIEDQNGKLSILLGHGAGGFGLPLQFSVGLFPQDLTVADFNADGKLDIAVSNGRQSTTQDILLSSLSVLFGDGSGSFGSAATFAADRVPGWIVSGDFNRDRRPDLITANQSVNNVSVLLNTCGGPIGLPPVLEFTAPAYSVSEGAGSITVTITRPGDRSGSSTVGYATSDTASLNNCDVINGVASARCDYTTAVGTIHFAAGEASKTISIPIIDDSYAEGSENFTITLSNALGATLGSPNTATVTIQDNEGTDGANPIVGTAFFVRQQYLDFLNREPDPDGFAAWQAVINNCLPNDITCDRIHVSSAFFRSPEFQDRGYFVYRFYPVAFGRKPDYDEFVPDIAKVSGFLSDAELEAAKMAFIAEFMSRPAFANTYNGLTDTQYVDTLLATAGVAPHQFRDFWIAALGNGTRTRATVLRDISESPEVYNKYFNQAFVVMQYFGYLRRQPDGQYIPWIQHLDSTGDYRSMINGFMNSLEYRARFGP